MATLTRTSTGGLRPNDRSAAHEAVRNLAESYGVDLLPLDLSTDITPTTLTVTRRCSEPSGPSDSGKFVDLNQLASAALSIPLEDSSSSPSKTEQYRSPGVVVTTPRSGRAQPSSSSSSTGASKSSTARSPSPAGEIDAPLLDSAATAGGVGLPEAAGLARQGAHEQAWLDGASDDGHDLTEDEVQEYQAPLEQRIALLEVSDWQLAAIGCTTGLTVAGRAQYPCNTARHICCGNLQVTLSA